MQRSGELLHISVGLRGATLAASEIGKMDQSIREESILGAVWAVQKPQTRDKKRSFSRERCNVIQR